MYSPYCSSLDSNYSHRSTCSCTNQEVSETSMASLKNGFYEQNRPYSEPRSDCNRYTVPQRFIPGDQPVEIRVQDTLDIELPRLSWHGYNCPPKVLSVTNTGRTVLINGQWTHGRPFIKGGPLNGSYIFSQVHFHCPSEHEIDGARYPLEMHAVHYKTSYLTQERAMRERDGTVVIVYLFKVMNCEKTALSNITCLGSILENTNTRLEIPCIALDQMVKPFSSNYYVYWGSVSTGNNSYLLQWIINCRCLSVTQQEIDAMVGIMNSCGTPASEFSSRMRPEKDAVFHVGEEEYCLCKRKSKSAGTFSSCSSVRRVKSCCSTSRTSSSAKLESEMSSNATDYSTSATSSQGNVTSDPQKGDESKSESSEKVKMKSKEKKKKRRRRRFSNLSFCAYKARRRKKEQKRQENSEGEEKEKEKENDKEKRKWYRYREWRRREKKKRENKKKETAEGEEDATKASSEAKDTENAEASPEKVETKVVENAQIIPANVETNITENARTSPEKLETKSPVKNSEKKVHIDENNVRSDKGYGMEECPGIESRPCAAEKKYAIEPTICAPAISHSFENFIPTVPDKPRESLSQKFIRRGEDLLTTIFRKKSDTRKRNDSSENNGDVQVNYLLAPNKVPSSLSQSLLGQESDTERMNAEHTATGATNAEDTITECRVVPTEILVNTATMSAIDQNGQVAPKEAGKELQLHMEHKFRSDKKMGNISSCIYQEYHVAIQYDNEIIQEYRGMFQPNRLRVGNYETMHLFPKYQEAKELQVRLKDCSVMLESVNQVCVRVKFLINDWGNGDCKKEFENKFKVDAETQYTIEKVGLKNDLEEEEPDMRFNLNINTYKESPFNYISSRDILASSINSEVNCNDEKSTEEKSQNQSLGFGQELDAEFRKQLGLSSEGSCSKKETKGKLRCKIRLLKNPEAYEGSDNSFASCRGVESKDSEEKSNSKTDSKLKVLKEKCKRTVYFMYDRIEKDATTGKKIFVGSFRTKEEIQSFAKQRQAQIQSDESSHISKETKENITSNDGSISEEVVKIDSLEKNFSTASKKNSEYSKKDVITLHKYKPKNSVSKGTKKQPNGIIIGRVLSRLTNNCQSFKHLAEIIGVQKPSQTKISICQLEPSKRDGTHPGGTDTAADGKIKPSGKGRQGDYSPSYSSSSNSGVSSRRSTLVKESVYSGRKKLIDVRDSQAALIIIPVEVESLSKIEVILIEHTEGDKKEKKVGRYLQF